MRLKPGYNGTFLPIAERNWGSYVAYILSSNLYREVLASENYFNLKTELQNYPSYADGQYKGNIVVERKSGEFSHRPTLY